MEKVEITYPRIQHDPRLKKNSYHLMQKFWKDGLVTRFEILENFIVWEVPLPNIDSPTAVQFHIPHERIIAEPLIVYGELFSAIAREQYKLNPFQGGPRQ